MLTEQEREQIRLIVDGVSGRLETKIDGMKELFTEKNNNICIKVEDHETRLRVVEKSLTYYIGKVAGIAFVLGGLGSVAVIIIQILVK